MGRLMRNNTMVVEPGYTEYDVSGLRKKEPKHG
jgi:hypothetical protein